MPAASVQAVGTLATGAGTCTPGVPSGTAAGSLLVAAISCLPDGTITTPTGYTNKLLDDDQAPGVALHYKKLSAPEGSPTAMSCGGGINNGAGIVLRVEDEELTADPFWATVSSASNGAGSTTSPAVSLTGAPAGLLVWVMAASAARDMTTVPTGFTRHTPTGSQRIHVCTKQHAGGDTGSVTGVISTGAGMTAGLALIENAIELVVADSFHGHATDAVILEQTHNLAGLADSAHEHSTEAVALAQTHILAGLADSAHGHATEGVTLEQTHILAVADSTHAHTAENVTLEVPAVELVVADSVHHHTGETVALVQTHDLAGVADSGHAHSTETVALEQTHLLAVGDSAHAHTADHLRLLVAVTTPPERTYAVPAEDRTLAVAAESRTLSVPAESRTVTA